MLVNGTQPPGRDCRVLPGGVGLFSREVIFPTFRVLPEHRIRLFIDDANRRPQTKRLRLFRQVQGSSTWRSPVGPERVVRARRSRLDSIISTPPNAKCAGWAARPVNHGDGRGGGGSFYEPLLALRAG
jgi:hypothetical protein